jgi:hypothetical protein
MSAVLRLATGGQDGEGCCFVLSFSRTFCVICALLGHYIYIRTYSRLRAE